MVEPPWPRCACRATAGRSRLSTPTTRSPAWRRQPGCGLGWPCLLSWPLTSGGPWTQSCKR
eukprot:2419519-Lingulodinium_polyedra.AAC.1